MSVDPGGQQRHDDGHVHAWRRDGAVLLPGFFSRDEADAVVADMQTVFGDRQGAEAPINRKRPGTIGAFDRAQFANFDNIPFDCSPALNLIGLHPALIALAKAALGVDAVRLYQAQAWAKYTGEADYDQVFHCDYGNHTLTAPSDDPLQNSITCIIYVTDVEEAHGPMHYVPRSETAHWVPPELTLQRHQPDSAANALQQRLLGLARSTAGPAGSLFAYGIDVWHRGTNLTAPRGRRLAVTATYRAAGNDAIGYTAWPWHHMKPWHKVFDHASPEQLHCLGVPRPGDRFWNETTIARTQVRYPGWDASPWRDAL